MSNAEGSSPCRISPGLYIISFNIYSLFLR
nr:MAG TPA_asm: hypothetical protein [Caudoviricetes sp.]